MNVLSLLRQQRFGRSLGAPLWLRDSAETVCLKLDTSCFRRAVRVYLETNRFYILTGDTSNGAVRTDKSEVVRLNTCSPNSHRLKTYPVSVVVCPSVSASRESGWPMSCDTWG